MSNTNPSRNPRLLLVFRLPEKPSRYRVSVWRRLKAAGAQVVRRALFILPDTPLNRLRAADLTHDVENWGGEAWIFAGGLITPSFRPKPGGFRRVTVEETRTTSVVDRRRRAKRS